MDVGDLMRWPGVGNVAELRRSNSLIDRAIYWVVVMSWIDRRDFVAAQTDAEALTRLKAFRHTDECLWNAAEKNEVDCLAACADERRALLGE